MKKYDIVSIGHITNDVRNMMGNKTPFTGGAAYFSPFAAKRTGASVLVITKMAAKDKPLLSALTETGIDVICLDSAHTTSIENAFSGPDMDKRTLNLISLADSFSASDIPADIAAGVFHIAGLFYGEVGEDMIPFLAEKGKTALDVQAVLRHIDKGTIVCKDWEQKKRYIPYVHYLKADTAEARVITGTDDKEKAAEMLFEWGAKEIVITEQKEVLVFDGKTHRRAPFNPSNQDGRVGRGDTCFLSYIARRLTHGIEDSARYAAALTSIKMEKPGPFCGTVEDVVERIKTQAY